MDDLHRETADPATIPSGHEASDVRIRPLAIFLATLAILLVVVALVMIALFNTFERRAVEMERERSPLAEVDRRTPGPLLQVSPRTDVQIMREREDRLLKTTEWVDRDQGLVRIPIDRAIKRVAEEGFPNWPTAEAEDQQAGEREAATDDQRVPAASSPEGTGQTTPAEGEHNE